MKQSWSPPATLSGRHVAVIGAGVLGRRIGCIWASGGFDVSIYDPNADQRAQATEYITHNIDFYAQKTKKSHGKYHTVDSLAQAVKDAWLVIECVPEKLVAKINIFGELVTLTSQDTILATNSSSYKSSEMLDKVPNEDKRRVLNMHYYMPPSTMIVELMTDGYTDPAIIEYLVHRSREVGTLPYVARKESTGFIFNRLWAAVKRETLTILAEGVSTPEEIDSMWSEMFVKAGSLPCKTMDAVGLDTVAFIEGHYIAERGLSSEMTVDYLKREYLDSQKLGNKSVHGGLYPPTNDQAASLPKSTSRPQILALDIGLSSPKPSSAVGEILKLLPGGQIKSLVQGQAMPDGLAVDAKLKQMFWTCMGTLGKTDGALYSANTDGSNIKTVIAPGLVHTPKQLALDPVNKKIYFCDREGLAVYCCGYDGSDLQQLVNNKAHGGDEVLGWCVGIALAPSLGKLFWTQKGPSKGGKGRLFSANLPEIGKHGAKLTGVQCLLENLPEPIDLEFDEESRTLYWTDRGELPHGNTLNKTRLDPDGSISQDEKEVVARHFHEAIGLSLDITRKQIYVTDLGGSICSCSLDGKSKKTLFTDEDRAFTGVTYL